MGHQWDAGTPKTALRAQNHLEMGQNERRNLNGEGSTNSKFPICDAMAGFRLGRWSNYRPSVFRICTRRKSRLRQFNYPMNPARKALERSDGDGVECGESEIRSG